ncbi:MAG: cell division protein FtsB [Xanthomonadales bacterium]|nr:cell division protein FtsB [Xanthomonadales bacterium]
MARLIAVVLAVFIVLLQLKYWVGEGGVREVEALRERVAAQSRENAKLLQRNDELAAEVEELRAGQAALEERVRTELGMIKPGETFYRVVELPPGGKPAHPTVVESQP